MSDKLEPSFYFEHAGFCPVCEHSTKFVAHGPYFRNTLICLRCNSLPRHRAVMHTLKKLGIAWRLLATHESSPGRHQIAAKFATESQNYLATHYDVSLPPGSIVQDPTLPCGSYRVEDLEKQTFENERFDLIVTQDVFEHLFRPDLAIKEIARTLKPGGITVMTVPLTLHSAPSRRRAKREDGITKHLLKPDYHGNPISGEGTLVTFDWGYDILQYLNENSGLFFSLYDTTDIDQGIKAELNEVLVGRKYDKLAI